MNDIRGDQRHATVTMRTSSERTPYGKLVGADPSAGQRSDRSGAGSEGSVSVSPVDRVPVTADEMFLVADAFFARDLLGDDQC